VEKKVKKNEWVVYPDIYPTIEELKNHYMNENENGKEEGFIHIPKIEEEGLIKEFPTLDTQANKLENENKIDISSIKPVEEIIPSGVTLAETESLPEQILGKEKKELTEEEKRAKFIEAIKQSHIRYHPRKKFGIVYKKKRKIKNKMQKQSHKNNR
jgi:hypothetical protein